MSPQPCLREVYIRLLVETFMAGEPTPPNVPPPNNKALLRAY